jgi:hypothetical protein
MGRFEDLAAALAAGAAERLAAGASDRVTWRLSGPAARGFGADTIVVARYHEVSRHGLESFLGARERLAGLGLRVPEILGVDRERGLVVQEDLGRRSLADWVAAGAEPERLLVVYGRILSAVRRLHECGADDPFWRRPFDRGERRVSVEAIYRYDFDYHVMELLFRRHWGWTPRGRERADMEELFTRVSGHLAARVRGVMLRDLQSANVLLDEEERPWFIDFQDARLGVSEYDLASLAWDSYVPFAEPLRWRIVELYRAEAGERDPEAERTLSYAVIQRKLHDAGAFAAAAHLQGKRWFLRWLDEAVRMAVTHLDRCPELPPVGGLLRRFCGE